MNTQQHVRACAVFSKTRDIVTLIAYQLMIKNIPPMQRNFLKIRSLFEVIAVKS